jgi:hypothetical protein
MNAAIDFTLSDIHRLVDCVGFGDQTEHEGLTEKLEALDYKRETDARSAIRIWLLPTYKNYFEGNSEAIARFRYAFQVVLTRWGFLPHASSLPGIDELNASDEMRYPALRQFYLWLWDEIFHSDVVGLESTKDLEERIDSDFINFPKNPEYWGTAKYRSLQHWDDILQSAAWHEGWVSK